MRAIFNSRNLTALEEIELGWSHCCQEVVEALCGTSLPLKMLGLSGLELKDKVVVQLLNSPVMAGLNYLDLSFTQISQNALLPLTTTKFKLAILNIKNIAVSD